MSRTSPRCCSVLVLLACASSLARLVPAPPVQRHVAGGRAQGPGDSRSTLAVPSSVGAEPGAPTPEAGPGTSSSSPSGAPTTEAAQTTTVSATRASTSAAAATPTSGTSASAEATSARTGNATAEVPEQSPIVAEKPDGGMPSGIIAVVMAVVFAVVVVIVYAGLLLWRRYLEYRYGNRELLVNDLEFDTNDLRHFEL